MTVEVYVIVDPKGDRPYVSTTRPSDERIRSLEEQGCEVWTADVLIPTTSRARDAAAGRARRVYAGKKKRSL